MPDATPQDHVDLLERPLFLHLATVRPDGAPQSNPMWFDWDGELIRFTHIKTRQKFRNLISEPRVALSIHDPDDPYRSLEVRGRVDSITDDPTGDFFVRLARQYGSDIPVSNAHLRVVIAVRPTGFIRIEGGHVVH